MKKNKKILTVFLLLLVTVPIAYLVWNNNQPEEAVDETSPGSAPSAENQEKIDDYYQSCPFVKLVMVKEVNQSDGEYYSIIDFDCDEDNQSETATIEVTTPDLETGKAEFRAWLAENGLEESDRLRVEYVHVP